MKKILSTVLLLLLLGLCACARTPNDEVTGITINADNAKYWYLSGQGIDPTGLVITATLSSGGTMELDPADCEFVMPPFVPYGEKEVKVTFDGFEASYTIYTCPSALENDDYITYKIHMNENGSRVSLTPVLVGDNKPFVLIFPGGGYEGCSPYGNDGYAYAAEIKKAGYNAFILEYSVKMEHPAPLDDVNTALEIIEDCKDFFGVTMDNYAVMGSSAGGHLAASWCTKEIGFEHYGKKQPAAALLAYAVTHASGSSGSVLMGEHPSEDLCHALSPDENVDVDYPPTYQWVFDEDHLGIAEHTALMDAALEKAGVEHITRIYPGTAHGTGLSIGLPSEGWIDEAIDFWAAHIN